MLRRAPHSDDWLLPKRAGFGFFELAMKAGGFLPRPVFSWAALSLLLAGLLIVAWRIWKLAASGAAAKARSKAQLGAGAAAAALLVWMGLRVFLDLLQNAYFPHDSLDLREPALVFAATFVFGGLWAFTSLGLANWLMGGARSSGRRRAGIGTACLVGASAFIYAWGLAFCDLGKADLAQALGLEPEPSPARAVLILSESSGRPDWEFHRAPAGWGGAGFSESGFEAARRLAQRPSVHRWAALRYLYNGLTVSMDAAGLRAALELGTRLGDPLARLLLLESLSADPASAGSREILALLSDESRFRVGSQAAARLAAIYHKLGNTEDAEAWLGRAHTRGFPKGLLRLPPAGPRTGAIRGRLSSNIPVHRLGLYESKAGAFQLGPGQLVDSVAPGSRGAFIFRDLPEGDYFLALGLEGEQQPLRVRGNPGVITLKTGRRINLAPLQISR